MKAIWKGTITFTDLSVPVKLYTAISDIRPHSHLLHDRDEQRLEQILVCGAQDAVIDRSETVRGFEIAEGQYVIVEPGDLERFEPDKSTSIEVIEFIEAGIVDSRYIEKAYYLGPDGDAQRFVTLVESLKKADSAGVCRWTMRKESHLGILIAGDGVLELLVHRSANQVVPEDSLAVEEVEVSAREKEIAKKLIAEFEGEFNPRHYRDEYQEKLKDLIDRKASGKVITFPTAVRRKETQDKELLRALEKSLTSLGKK